MPVDFGLLSSPNIGGALNAGMQAGREMKRQQVVQNALAGYAQNPGDPQHVNALIAADPGIGFKLQDRQREQSVIDARRAVFAGPQLAMGGMPAPAADGAPMTLVDPSALPPRTDGLQINQDALRQLYQLDPDSAMEVQKTIYAADAAGAKRMQQSGELMATAAYRLSQMPQEARAGELQAMMPQLTAMGLDPQTIARADLSDASLQRFMTIGRSIKDVMAEDAAKYVSVPYGGRLVNVRDPDAIATNNAASTGGTAASPAAPIQPGASVNGRTFRGGDYRDPANWVTGGAPSQGGATFP